MDSLISFTQPREKEKEEIKVKPIKDSQEYFPETHTVVLYKNPPVNGKHEIMVIDPNNFTFSTHLAGEDIKFQHEAFDKVTTIYKTTQIYKPDNNNIGLGNNQYRDCTDIAVKIAFGLNGKKNWEKINSESTIKNCEAIQAISNNKSIDTAFSVKGAVRIKQTSDMETVFKFYENEKLTDRNLEIITKYFPNLKFPEKNAYNKILNNVENKNNDFLLNELLDFGKITADALRGELEREYKDLIGSTNETLGE